MLEVANSVGGTRMDFYMPRQRSQPFVGTIYSLLGPKNTYVPDSSQHNSSLWITFEFPVLFDLIGV